MELGRVPAADAVQPVILHHQSDLRQNLFGVKAPFWMTTAFGKLARENSV
jgi:hypothetical protein